MTIVENNNQDLEQSEASPLLKPRGHHEHLNMISSAGPDINPDRYLVTKYMVPKPLTQKGRKRNVNAGTERMPMNAYKNKLLQSPGSSPGQYRTHGKFKG